MQQVGNLLVESQGEMGVDCGNYGFIPETVVQKSHIVYYDPMAL